MAARGAPRGSAVTWGSEQQLVERYGWMVWAVACAHGLGPADAGDVSRVTWLLLTQHLGSLAQPERLGVWLHATATREAFRMRRLRGSAQVSTSLERSWPHPAKH